MSGHIGFSTTCGEVSSDFDCKPLPVHRPNPTLSRREKNRLQHSLNGNTSPLQQPRTKGRFARTPNSENRPPTNSRNSRKRKQTGVAKGWKKRPKKFQDDQWLPPTPSDSPPTSTSSSTSTTDAFSRKEVSHSALTALQTSRHFTDRDMAEIVKLYNNHGAQHEPNFIPYRTRLRSVFRKFFKHCDFVLPDETLPAVFCADMSGLLRSLQELHNKDIVRVHIGCDYGGDFLKIAISPIFRHDEGQQSVSDTGELQHIIHTTRVHYVNHLRVLHIHTRQLLSSKKVSSGAGIF